MFVKDGAGAAPDAVVDVVQPAQRWQKLAGVVLRAFQWQKRGQVVDGRDIQRRVVPGAQGRCVPGGGAIIDLDGREIRSRITGDVADHGQPARIGQISGDEHRGAGHRQDTVEEYRVLRDFGEGAAMGGFGHVPFCDRHAHFAAKVRRAGADPAKRADDDGLGGGDVGHGRAQVADQGGFLRVAGDRAADRAVLLRLPAFQRDSRSGIARPIAKGGDAAAGVVQQVFQIVQRAAALAEPLQQGPARRLPLEGMAEHDVPVAQQLDQET